MQQARTNILTRDDTFFGVCEAIGEDLGFHPNYLRVALAVALFFDPFAAVAGYAAAGLIVALIRWLVPNPAAAEAIAGEPALEAASPKGENDMNSAMLAEAA